jgi:hypothetical protein
MAVQWRLKRDETGREWSVEPLLRSDWCCDAGFLRSIDVSRFAVFEMKLAG